MKVRVKFGKQGVMRYIGHLDIMRYFQKCIRKANVDIAYSSGFSPHQIMSFASPLGVGLESTGEEYVQSERFAHYEHYLAKIKEMGLTYPCYCTKADILATQAPHETDGHIIYKGTCRNLPPSTNGGGATRLIVPDKTIRFTDGHYGEQHSNLATDCGDFIIRRKDGAWAYQLAVVVDDALNGITEVVRGRDLLPSVPQQLYLYELLQFDAPRFIHIPLLINTDGQRLCKRDKSLDLGVIRSIYSAEQVIGKLAHIAGITETDAPVKAKDLVPLFDWNKIPTRDITVSTV